MASEAFAAWRDLLPPGGTDKPIAATRGDRGPELRPSEITPYGGQPREGPYRLGCQSVADPPPAAYPAPVTLQRGRCASASRLRRSGSAARLWQVDAMEAQLGKRVERWRIGLDAVRVVRPEVQAAHEAPDLKRRPVPATSGVSDRIWP